MAGLPAIAVSLCGYEDLDFGPAARVTRALVERLFERPLPPRTILNVNVPARAWDELQGLRWCRQSLSRFDDAYEERIDPRRSPYYWLTGSPIPIGSAPDDDLRAVSEGWVAVTPLTIDWTHEGLYQDGGASLLDGLRVGGQGAQGKRQGSDTGRPMSGS